LFLAFGCERGNDAECRAQSHAPIVHDQERFEKVLSMPLLECNIKTRSNLWLALVVCLGGAATTPALALECPQPQMQASHGALKETPQVIATRSATLKARGSAAIPQLIFQIRKSDPGSSDAEITNYLMTAYCPVVNRKRELTDEQKKQDLARFASQVRRQLP
jgi:hypothetical protein